MFHASTRFFLQRIVAVPKLSSNHVLLPAVTRSFHLSRVILAASEEAHETGKIKKITPVKLTKTRLRLAAKGLDKEIKKRTAKPKKVKEGDVEPKEVKNKPRKAKKKAKSKPRIVLRPEDMPPQHPGSPYIFFASRRSAGRKYPNNDAFLDHGKQNTLAYKSLSDDEKKKLLDEYDAARADYIKNKDEYLKTVDPSILAEINRRRQKQGKKKLRKPGLKQPLNAYFRYALEKRTNNTISRDLQSQRIFLTQCGEEWRAMSDADKQPYIDSYIQDKKEYDSARLQA